MNVKQEAWNRVTMDDAVETNLRFDAIVIASCDASTPLQVAVASDAAARILPLQQLQSDPPR